MADLQSLKVPVFAGINDTPIEPSTAQAGNGSHLVNKFNLLVDNAESEITNLQDYINSLANNPTPPLAEKWVVVEDDYTAESGNKVVFKTNQPGLKSTYFLNLPSSPPLGSYVSFINTNQSITVEVINFDKFNGGYATRIYVQDAYKLRTLIYIGQDIGWIPTTVDDYTKEYGGGS